MSETVWYSYSGIVLLLSIVLGCIGTFSMFRKRRFADGTFSLSMYIAPPLILFALAPSIEGLLRLFAPFRTLQESQLKAANVFLFSPLIAFWALWLVFGGFEVFGGNINVRDFVRQHLTRVGLKNKIVGAALMFFGVIVFVITMALIGPSLLRLPTFAIAMLAYFRGAIYIIFPEKQRWNP